MFDWWHYDDKNRFRIPKTIRQSLDRATQITQMGSLKSGKLESHALDFPMDRKDLDDAGLMMTMQSAADMTAQLMGLAHEKNVVDQMLTAAGAGTDINVNGAGIDILKTLDAAVIELARKAKLGSKFTIKALLGPYAEMRLRAAAAVLNRYKTSAAGKGISPTAASIMEMVMGNVQSQTVMSILDAAPEGSPTESVDFLVGDALVLFVSTDAPTQLDPSFMKTFRMRGNFMVPGYYTRDDGRVEVVKFDDMYMPTVTNSIAVTRLNIKDT